MTKTAYEQLEEERDRLRDKVLAYEALLLEIHRACRVNCDLQGLRTVIMDKVEKVWMDFESKP